jgi:nucleoside-triphosphatase THEP1
MTTAIQTTNVTIDNVGKFEIPTSKIPEVIDILQNAQKQLREVLNSNQNDDKILING